jgi:short-subunit dehydrogenase
MNTVLITGSSAGIGKATAKLFASKGWQVVATMRTPEKATDLREIKNIHIYALDVAQNEKLVGDVVNKIVDDLGCVNVLINNAGIGVFGAFEVADFNLIETQFDINLLGLMRVTRAVLPHFRNQNSGTIINISSGVGRMALPMQSLYSSSKFAIEGFSEALQYELKPLGIRVKIVEPGTIKTDFFGSLIIANSEQITAYRTYQEKVMANHFKRDEQGATPEIVAEVIYQAVTDGSDRLRYPAGQDVSLFLRLRKLLPDSLFFRLVRQQLEKDS